MLTLLSNWLVYVLHFAVNMKPTTKICGRWMMTFLLKISQKMDLRITGSRPTLWVIGNKLYWSLTLLNVAKQCEQIDMTVCKWQVCYFF